MSLSGPSSCRALPASRSSWPTWTPSAPTWAAISTLSLMMLTAPFSRHKATNRSASARKSAWPRCFSRSWTMPAPPSMAAATWRSSPSVSWAQARSVTAYSRSCLGSIFIRLSSS